jgi:hypothetical protein
MKLEQRLSSLTRQLANARRDGDREAIEALEDEIDRIEIEMEEAFDARYDTDWD